MMKLKKAHEEVHDAVVEIASQFELASKRAVVDLQGNHPEGMCLVASGVLGAAVVLAALVGNGYGPGQTEGEATEANATTQQSLTYALLLAAAAAFINPGEERHVGINFGPHAMLKAMDWFETLTGYKPDDFLHQRMVKAVRKYEAETPPDARINPEQARQEAARSLLN